MAISLEPRPEDFFTDQIKRILVKDVADAIEQSVMPDMKKLVETYAEQAVAHWAVAMRSQKELGMYGDNIQIQIDFVENVVRTISVENPIKIKRKQK